MTLIPFTPWRPGRAADRDPADLLAMTTALAEVRGYWEGLRQGDALPRRAEIDPRGMNGALKGAFLAERIAPGIARLRVAGGNFSDLLGMDMRGMPLSAVFDTMGRARLAPLLDRCFLRPAILELTLRAEAGFARPALGGRMVLLPLQTDGSDPEMVLGCMMFTGQTGKSPRRLSVISSQFTAVTPPGPATGPAGQAGFRPLALRPVPAAIPPGAAPLGPPEAKRPHLRLVDPAG